MSTYWYFACRNCPSPQEGDNREQRDDGIDVWSDSDFNHGEHILAELWRLRSHIAALLRDDRSGYIEVTLMGYGSAAIDFLLAHMDHPGFEACSEYGDKLDLEAAIVQRHDGSRYSLFPT